MQLAMKLKAAGLLLTALVQSLVATCEAQASATVANGAQLLQALNESNVATIYLSSSPVSWPAEAGPSAAIVCVISRNVTITKAPGFSGRPVLAPGRQFARLKLAQGAWLQISEVQVVGLLNFGMPGAGWTTLDLLAASPDAFVLLANATWLQLMCPPFQTMQQGMQAVPAPVLPRGISAAQLVDVLPDTTTWNDASGLPHAPGGLLIRQLSQKQVVLGNQGGFLELLSNVTLACAHMLPEGQCQQPSQIPACMTEQTALLDPFTGQLLNTGQALVGNTSNEQGSRKGTSKVLGAVLGVAGGVCLLCAAAFLAWRRYYQQQQQYSRHKKSRGSWGTSSGVNSDSLIPSRGTTSSAQHMTTATTSSGHALMPMFNLNAVNTGADLTDLQLGVLIGTGSFGRVYRGSWRGADVAVKKIIHSRAETVKIQRELGLSLALKHPNLVESLDFALHEPQGGQSLGQGQPEGLGSASSQVSSLPSSGYLFPSLYPQHTPGSQGGRYGQAAADLETWIVQELCDKGPLSAALFSGHFGAPATRSHASMCELLVRAHDVASGLQFLHARGVCHGDLKSDNTLLRSDTSDPFNMCLKICDFGLSRALADGRTHVTSRNCGTVTHMSPEVLMHGRLKPSADVYSLGMLLWEMLTGHRPYKGLTEGEIVHSKVVDKTCLQLPAAIPHDVVSLVQSCWNFNPELRPSCDDIVTTLAALIQGMHPDLAARLAPSWKHKAALAAAAATAPKLSATAISEEASGSDAAAGSAALASLESKVSKETGNVVDSSRGHVTGHHQYVVYCYDHDVPDAVRPQVL